MDLGIEGRTALVMGASKGIGKEIAGAWRARAPGRDLQPIRGIAASRCRRDRRRGARLSGGDTKDLDRLRQLPGEVGETVGPVDILVANTGGPPTGAALDNSLEEWEEAFRSLVLAPRVLLESVVPGMKERGWGRIVNVSSTSIREPIPYLTLSNANRLAALGLLETLADEVAADGITVNTVATGMFGDGPARRPRGLAEGGRGARQAAGPRQATGPAGGVRRPGRVPVLGAGRPSHGIGDPARRRPTPVGLARPRRWRASGPAGRPPAARRRRRSSSPR